MTRKKIPAYIQDEILIKSMRRCCICFGLNRNTSIQSGQIAHLDKNNSNNIPENLAFLCLEHHDEYDSSTSQRKGFTVGEVKHYRDDLYKHTSEVKNIEVAFGQITIPPKDPYAGSYIANSSFIAASAEVTLTPIPSDIEGNPAYLITGISLYGTDRKYGPNIGTIRFIGDVIDNKISYTENNYNISIELSKEQIIIIENSSIGYHGMGVSFSGKYLKS